MTDVSATDALIVIDRVSKAYTTGEGQRLALQSTSFDVGRREFVSIVGPSGCGKSTLLMIVAGLLSPTAGEVAFEGAAVTAPPKGLAVVFQDYSRSLFPWMSVRRNLTMATAPDRLPKQEVNSRLEHVLASVGLPDVAHLYPWQLSGGMQQRVAIARALITKPQALLMDEPFAAVDAQTRADLEDLLLAIREEYGVTVLFVTHDIDESVYLSDRVVVMAAAPGRVIADIKVPLSYPRHQIQTKRDPLFAELRGEVYRLIKRPDPEQ